MIPVTGIEDFATSIATFALADGRFVLACVHQATPGSAEIAHAKAYLVGLDGFASAPFLQSEPYGKDINVSLFMMGQMLYMVVSEAMPGGPGTSARVDIYSALLSVGGAPTGPVLQDALVRSVLREVRQDLSSLG